MEGERANSSQSVVMRIKQTSASKAIVESGPNASPSGERVAFSINEVSTQTNVGRTKIYDEIKKGRLVIHKCGRRSLIFRSDRDAWLEQMVSSEAKNSEE